MSATLELMAPSGLTLTVQLYPYGSDTIANGVGGDSLVEETNRKGLYTATVSQGLSGMHTVHVLSGSTPILVSDVRMVDGQTCRVRDADAAALQLLKAQRVIDTATTPWQLVLKDRDTDAELYRFDLLDEDGDDITDIETFVGQQITPP